MYHLIAITTVTRLKKHQADPRAPQIIASGLFRDCYQRAVELAGGRTLPEAALLLNEIPAFSTDTWTYFIVADKQNEDVAGIEGAL